MVSARRGFSLVEVIVAVTLLFIASLGIAATGFVAAQAFTRAEMDERVLREAEHILDSLVALPANGSGAQDMIGAQLSWAAADSSAIVVLRINLRGRPPFTLSAQR